MTREKPTRPFRPHMRLRGYDYTQPGAYFITVCTTKRANIFGAIRDDRMRTNIAGHIIEDAWMELPKHFSNIELDAFVVMPNHVHGLLILVEEAKQQHAVESSRTHSLSIIVGAFKSYSAKRINALRGTSGKAVWQQGFYDHIVRGEGDLRAIREYIVNNPLKWALDLDNEANWRRGSSGATNRDYDVDAGLR